MNYSQYAPQRGDPHRQGFRPDNRQHGSYNISPVQRMPDYQYAEQTPSLRMPTVHQDLDSTPQIQSAVRVEMRDPHGSPELPQPAVRSPSLKLDTSPQSPTSTRLVTISTPSPEARSSPGTPIVVKRGSPHQAQLISFKPEPLPQNLKQQAAQGGSNIYGGAPRAASTPSLHMPTVNIKIGDRSSSSRQDSTSSQFGALAANAKPQPQRRQYNEGKTEKPQKLDIERFEAIRRNACAQLHDPEVQMEYAKALAEAAEVLASRYTDPATPSTMHVDGKVEQRNRDHWTREALAITRKLALKVMLPEAAYFLGCSYSTGALGLEVDAARAFDLYTRAAKADHAQASYRAAVCYELGVGTRRDVDKALTWYKRAAQLGDVSSMYKLGMLALDGNNFEEGLTWLLRASDLGNASSPHALHELGLIYEGGERSCGRRRSSTHSRKHSEGHHRRSTSVTSIKSTGSSNTSSSLVQRDAAKALSFFYQAAKLGYAPSQFRIGHAYEYKELGCELDPQKSISWYTAAAEQGDAEAELALSGWYWTGAIGVLRKSETEAFLWAQRAADRGFGRAFFCLGHFYEYGIGVTAAPDRAKHWFAKALEQKHPKAAGRLKELERQATSITPDHIS